MESDMPDSKPHKKIAPRRKLSETQNLDNAKLLRRRAVENATGLPCSTLYDEMAAGKFPRPIELTPGRVAWIASEVEAWIVARISAARGGGMAKADAVKARQVENTAA
jgi:prophage regulatory protein